MRVQNDMSGEIEMPMDRDEIQLKAALHAVELICARAVTKKISSFL